MSSAAFDAIRLELPRRPWAQRASGLLAALAVAACLWVAARLWGPAAGLAVGGAVAAALSLARNRPCPRGTVELQVGARTRRLGPTWVVESAPTEAGHPGQAVWLTPVDLPAPALRRLGLRLAAARPGSGS